MKNLHPRGSSSQHSRDHRNTIEQDLADVVARLAFEEVNGDVLAFAEKMIAAARARQTSGKNGGSTPRPEGLLTVKGVCDLLGVSSEMVYRLAGTPHLPCVRIQGRGVNKRALRFRREDVERYVAGATTGGEGVST